MATRIAFLAQFSRLLLIAGVVVCLAAPMQAQRGGGGGHVSGGHMGGGGGGHASSGHMGGGGRFHFGFGRRSTRARGFVGAAPAARGRAPALIRGDGMLKPTSASLAFLRVKSEEVLSPAVTWSAAPASGLVKGVATTPVRRAPFVSIQPIPPTFFPSAFFLPDAFVHNGFFFFFGFNFRHIFFFGGFPFFTPSNCFFNGFSEFCFFEPVLPFFSPFGFSPFVRPLGFDPFLSPMGFGGVNSFGFGDDFDVLGTMQRGVPASAATEGTVGGNTFETGTENSSSEADAKAATQEENPSNVEQGKPLVLLVLKNGTNYDVTDYWLAEGYLEYITRDSARSHIPLDALDVQKTVDENSRGSVTFVLRSAPSDSR